MKSGHLTEDEIQGHLCGLSSPEDSSLAAAHLDACPPCRALAHSFRTLFEALDRLPAPQPPANFTAAVLARVAEREEAAASERRVGALILAGTGAAMAAAAALAGPSAFAKAVSETSADLVGAVRALRLSGEVLAPVFGALRLEIAIACAALGLPLLIGLSRLLPSRGRGTA